MATKASYNFTVRIYLNLTQTIWARLMARKYLMTLDLKRYPHLEKQQEFRNDLHEKQGRTMQI